MPTRSWAVFGSIASSFSLATILALANSSKLLHSISGIGSINLLGLEVIILILGFLGGKSAIANPTKQNLAPTTPLGVAAARYIYPN
jgi:hypothetical protein